MDATPATQTEQLTLALYLWDRYIERPFIWHLRKSFDPGFLESYFTLKHIQLHGPRTMTQLAAALGKSRQRTTQVVNRMIAQGHVRRVPDLADRRVVRIVLTQKAEASWANSRKSYRLRSVWETFTHAPGRGNTC